MSVVNLKNKNVEPFSEEKTNKEAYIESYLKSLVALEEAIEPYTEQKRELRKEYIENGWLFKDEIWAAVKAYRLIKDNADMEQLNEVYNYVKKVMGTSDVV